MNMNMNIMTKENTLPSTGFSNEFYEIIAEQRNMNLAHHDSDNSDHAIKSAILAEMEGFTEAKNIASLHDNNQSELYVFLLTYQSVKLENIERLIQGLEIPLLEEVIENHRESQATPNYDCFLLPVYTLLECSYTSLYSLNQLIAHHEGLDNRTANLINEMISVEKHLIARLDKIV